MRIIRWKETIERRIEQIEKSITGNSSPNARDLTSFHVPAITNGAETSSQSLADSTPTRSETSQDAVLNLSCSLGAFPASSLNNAILNDQDVASPDTSNLYTSTLGSQKTLEKHFAFYRNNLDPYIYHLLTEDDTLVSIQKRSSFLLAAISATASFCTVSNDNHIYFDKFIKEASAKMFSSSFTFDDVRALCIGAFWLGKVSSALNALGKLL